MEESIQLESPSLCNNEDQVQKTKLVKSQAMSKSRTENNEEEFTFTDLNDINPIILLKKPNAFRQCFDFLFKMAGQQLQNQNYDTSIKFYEKTIQLMDIGRNLIHKESFPELEYMKIIVFANMACANLNIRKLQKCNKFCQKAIDQIEKFLTSAEKQTFLKISITLMVLKFQNCAILSQLQQHQRSLQLCKSNLVLIKKYLQILDIFVRQTLTLTYQKRKSNQTVAFSRQVYKFAAQTIKQLLEYIEQPMLKKEEMVFYYWQKNPQKNEEQLLKRFIPMENQNCKRSILGVSKKNHWIDQFNIGSVMHMMPLKLEELRIVFPIEEYVFKDKLYQITIYSSMCYFTMATQTRFIDSNMKSLSQAQSPTSQSTILKQQTEQSPKKAQNLGNLKIMKKYGYSQKTEMFKRSQVYHLCSIDVMSRIVRYAIPYINHIIKSYQKHYIKEKKLEQIVAIIEQSFLEQDTVVNQSIAEYCPYDKTCEKSILQKARAFSKNNRNSHILESEPHIKDFDQIIEETNKIIEDSSQQDSNNDKVTQKGNRQSASQMHENSGEYLESVVKKKKSMKSSRTKVQKQPQKQLKQTKVPKRKVGSQKSPSHSIPLANPPKPPVKKKKV